MYIPVSLKNLILYENVIQDPTTAHLLAFSGTWLSIILFLNVLLKTFEKQLKETL